MHPLDNPICKSLGTSHSRFAKCSGPARRFVPSVSPLAGLERPDRDGFAALAALASPGDSTALFLRERGKTPFLHVLPENARAVELYERLGFTKRALFRLLYVRRA